MQPSNYNSNPEETDDEIPFLRGEFTLSDRAKHILVAIILGAFTGWVIWIVNTFLDVRTWIDRLVWIVLHEFAIAVGLFAVALAVHALFATRTFRSTLATATRKLQLIIMIIFLSVFGTLVFIALYANGVL